MTESPPCYECRQTVGEGMIPANGLFKRAGYLVLCPTCDASASMLEVPAAWSDPADKRPLEQREPVYSPGDLRRLL